MPRLEIYFLGDFRIVWKKVPLNPFPTRKARALFAYLVTHRNRTVTRAQLAGIFWGDFSEDRASRNLSTTLWRIRQIIPENYVNVQGDLVSFDQQSDYWLDTQAFEALCESAEAQVDERIAALDKAIRLYRGDFLEGLYEEWALVETERLRSMFLQAMHELMGIYSDQGDSQNALNVGLNILRFDPLREDIHLSVMKIYALLGHRQAALQQFQACKRILKKELDIDPTAEMLALYDQVRAMPALEAEKSDWAEVSRTEDDLFTSRRPFDDFGRIPLVGRSDERSALLGRVDRLDDLGGGLVLLEGEPGVGKTRLVEEIAAGAEWRGVQVFWGYCGDEPFAPLIDILSQALTPLRISQVSKIMDVQLFACLAPLFPKIGELIVQPDDPQFVEHDEKEVLHQALVASFAALCQITPHVLIIENWHRMDGATLEYLPQLAKQLSEMRLLILGTARGGELRDRRQVWQQVLELDRDGLLSCLNLATLSWHETQKLVQLFLDQEKSQDEISTEIYAHTQGNPLFILETLKIISENEQISKTEDGIWLLDIDKDALLPKVVQEVIKARLDKVTPVERMLLDIASVLDEPFDYDVWIQTAGWDDEAILFHSNNLLQRQLLVEMPVGYRFGHELIRQVTYDQLDPVRSRDYHRRAGEVLSQSHPERVEELARHFHYAEEAQLALKYALQAGGKAERLHASQSAVDFYTWALAWAGEIGGEAGKLGLVQAAQKRGLALEILGNNAQALEDFETMYLAAENLGEIGQMAKARRLIGWCAGDRLGDRQRGLQEARRALDLAIQADDRQLIALIYRDMGAFHNMLGQHNLSIEALHAALEIFRELGDQKGEAACLQFLAVGFHFSSQYQRSLQHYQEALNLWRENGRKVESANTLCDIGYLLLSQGKLTPALESLQESMSIFEEIGARGYLSWVLLGIGALHRYKLQGDESLRVLNQSLAYAQEAEKISPFTTSLIALHRGMALWGLGQFVETFDSLEKSLTQAREGNIPTLIVGILVDYGRCLRQVGRVEHSLEYHQEALKLAKEIDFQDGIVRARSELGLGLLVSGASAEGLQLLDAARKKALELTEWKLAEASINLAEAHFLARNLEQALTNARLGVKLASALELGELAIWGHLILGSILLAFGNPEESKEALERGLALGDGDCLSLARFRLLLALEVLSCSQRSDQRTLHLYQRLQDFVDRLYESIRSFGYQGSLLDELRRLSLLAGVELIIPTQGQVYATVRKADGGPGDCVRILWTLDAGKSDEMLRVREGKVALRRQRILRLITDAARQGADPTQEEIAAALGVSVRTIRSDLRALQK